MTIRSTFFCTALLVAVLASGCNSSPPTPGGAPKPLPPGRIPKAAGPTSR